MIVDGHTITADACGLDPAPVVELHNWFDQPFNNSVATARTCYSSKVIYARDVDKDERSRRQTVLNVFCKARTFTKLVSWQRLHPSRGKWLLTVHAHADQIRVRKDIKVFQLPSERAFVKNM